MNTRSLLSREDYEEYLLRLVFGAALDGDVVDYVSTCVARGYLDICRTLSGIADLPGRDALKRQAEEVVRARLEDLRQSWTPTPDQESFDAWHREVCTALIDTFDRHDYRQLCIGQAQKWVNVTFKCLFAMGDQRVSGFGHLYPFCHIPLDAPLIARLVAAYGFPPLSTPWSRLTDYQEYLAYQQRVRQRFVLAPLDIEFLVSMNRPQDRQRIV
jgi:hypothetical protein